MECKIMVTMKTSKTNHGNLKPENLFILKIFNNQQSDENDIEAGGCQERQGGQAAPRVYYPTDNLDKYEFDGDSDTELEELNQYRNSFEDEIKFSKRGIIDFIEKTLDEENSEQQQNFWELKLDKEDVKIFIKKNGSSRNSEQPFVKTQILFNSAYTMEKLIESIFSNKHRTQWDKNVMKLETIPLQNKSTCLSYQLNKGILNMNNRDFLDKQIKFVNDGKLYVLYSAIPNDIQVKPTPNRTDRASTIIGMQKMERRKDGKIVYQMLMQGDLKMKVTPKLITMFLPNGLQDWVKRCNKYYMENHEKL